MDISSITDVMKQELHSFLEASGKGAQEAKEAMSKFVEEMSPEIEKAIASGDAMSLDLLRDITASRAGRTAITLLFDEQKAVTSTITSIARAAISFGLLALA